MKIYRNILRLCLIAAVTLSIVGCEAERQTYEGPDYVIFSAESHDLGILDSEEWFEIPISATRTAEHDRLVGVEIVASSSSAIEGLHYVMEASTVKIPAGKLTTAARIKGIPQNISVADELSITLRLVIDEELVWDRYGTETVVHLHKCCPLDIDIFTGYAKITSTWIMQYMNAEARLVRTMRDDKDENTIIVKDMFYDGYDIRLRLLDDNRLMPLVEMEQQTVGSTGEAFGTIYGNGKLEMTTASGYTSYYSPCEMFVMQYVTLFVEEVGTVGTYVNIFEWISDDEAERIMREGF